MHSTVLPSRPSLHVFPSEELYVNGTALNKILTAHNYSWTDLSVWFVGRGATVSSPWFRPGLRGKPGHTTCKMRAPGSAPLSSNSKSQHGGLPMSWGNEMVTWSQCWYQITLGLQDTGEWMHRGNTRVRENTWFWVRLVEQLDWLNTAQLLTTKPSAKWVGFETLHGENTTLNFSPQNPLQSEWDLKLCMGKIRYIERFAVATCNANL